MPVYKDDERGTWYVRCYYEDFTGKKKQIKKRGFKLQREAKEWEADFLRKQKATQICLSALCMKFISRI